MCSPISAECQLVPQAVMTMLSNAEQLVVGQVQAAELRRPLLVEQTAAHRVLDRLRLLEDLLEHEVREAAALDLLEIPVDLADLLLHARSR